MQFHSIGKLCRQYGCRPGATGRMVDTALLLLDKRKLEPPRLTSTFSTAFTATPTRHCSSKRRSSKKSASAGSFTGAGGAQWQRGYGSPSPGRQTPEQVPSPPPAPQQHLPSNAEEGESAAGEGARGMGATSQDGRRVTDLDNESDVDMTGVGPALPLTRKAPAAEAGVGAGAWRVAEDIPRHHRPPPGGSKPTAAATAATPKMTEPVGGEATTTPATVQAAASATRTCPSSQGQR